MLAPLLAGRPRVRESRTGGHTYLRRWERPLTARLPAVPIYSAAGDTRVLVIDLDVSRGGRDAVLRDAAAVTALVRAAGGRVIVDESPSGGRHVYVPLTVPVGFHDARDLALALALRTPSVDPSPNQNLTDGLIRPPGSVHPSGGHQVLHGPLTAAQQLAAAAGSVEIDDQHTGVARGGVDRHRRRHRRQPHRQRSFPPPQIRVTTGAGLPYPGTPRQQRSQHHPRLGGVVGDIPTHRAWRGVEGWIGTRVCATLGAASQSRSFGIRPGKGCNLNRSNFIETRPRGRVSMIYGVYDSSGLTPSSTAIPPDAGWV